MQNMIKTLFPNFPEDRKVVTTMDNSRFFKINYPERTLYVPNKKVLSANLHLVDNFIDTVKAFGNADLDNPTDWSTIKYVTDLGDEARALDILATLRREIYTGERPVYISCDIETRNIGLRDNKLLAIGFCVEDMHALILTQFTPKVLDELEEIFEASSDFVRWIWQNGKFDTVRLKWMHNINSRIDEDTMLMHYVGINERRGTHGLKELGTIFCQAPTWEDELDRIRKEYCSRTGTKIADFTYDMFPPKELHRYLAYDVIVGRKLYFTMKPLMRSNSEFIYTKLIEAANVYRTVELNGIQLDEEYLEELEYGLEKDIDRALIHVDHEVARVWNPVRYMQESGAKSMPKFFNMKSPAQLKWLLESVTGQRLPNTTADTLDNLFEEVGDSLPIINAIRDLRKLNKYMDTYVQGLREVVAPDGRVHSTYNLHGTETGRLSSSGPNMQNIPRDARIKNLFVAAPGYKLVQLDYSQAELRVLAYLSKDEFLSSVYVNDEDLHDQVALRLFGEGFTKEDRVKAKIVNFGIVYGLGPGRLSQQQKMPMDEARKIINGWLETASGAKKWITAQRNMVHKNETPTTLFGRERHFTVTHDALNHIQNEYVNFPVQSIASDLTMFSLLAMQHWIETWDLQERVRIVINVHDSIVLEVEDNDELVRHVASACKTIMCEMPEKMLPDLAIPFKADVEVGYRWGELKPLQIEEQ